MLLILSVYDTLYNCNSYIACLFTLRSLCYLTPCMVGCISLVNLLFSQSVSQFITLTTNILHSEVAMLASKDTSICQVTMLATLHRPDKLAAILNP